MTVGAPYGPSYPHRPEPPKPPVPQPVQNAFYLMLAAAVLQVGGIVVALTQTGKIHDSLVKNDPNVSSSTANALSGFTIFLIVFFGVVEVAIWIWMAYKNKAGRQWARIVATVLFGLSCLSVVSSVLTYAFQSSIHSVTTSDNGNTHTTNFSLTSSTNIVGVLLGVVIWGIGLTVIILLWRRQSSDYFVPRVSYGSPGYGFPPPPGYPPQAYDPRGYTAPGPPPGYGGQGYPAGPDRFTPSQVSDPPPTEPSSSPEGFQPPE